jgi:hypothetical protein
MVGRRKPALATILKNETSFNADISHTASVLGAYHESRQTRYGNTAIQFSRS